MRALPAVHARAEPIVSKFPRVHGRVVAVAAAVAVLFILGLVTGAAWLTRETRAPARGTASVVAPPSQPDFFPGHEPLRPSDADSPVAEETTPDKQPPLAARPFWQAAATVLSSWLSAAHEAITSASVRSSFPAGNAGLPAAKVAVKRRHYLTDEDLRKQLLRVPEVTKAARTSERSAPHLTPELVSQRPELAGLPLRMGADCHLGKEAAENLQALAHKLRTHLDICIPKDNSPDPRVNTTLLRRKLRETASGASCEWLQPEALPTLVQMLQVENKPSRLLLIELLAQVHDPAASVALAQRALFDLSAEVRRAALQALAERPRDEYRDVLLAGFRYPWPPVADHAAEALVALQDREAVPRLLSLLQEADPTAYSEKGTRTLFVRELVRINHLGNCRLCHAPSLSVNDPVRGQVPTPGQPLGPPTGGHSYGGNTGNFVRADITYLKQDFSVFQPVEKPGAWPTTQRYDYLVRTRPLTVDDLGRQ
ncbi:MAG: HEAT repeat domain-containing protein, partial [Gemmataceae bacterium]|nr:HEAT repeat domain-containing protein [Gemmataceae bacterium]